METTEKAVLPDVIPAPLQIIEGYLKQAEDAFAKITEHLAQINQMKAQREKELIVVTGQKELLGVLQKQIANITKIETKP